MNDRAPSPSCLQGRPPLWRALARGLLVPLLSWFLLAHSVLFPVARALAIEDSGIDSRLAALCLSGALTLGIEPDGVPTQHSHDDLGCCPLHEKSPLDAPTLVPFAFEPILVPENNTAPAAFLLPQGRGPPAITATPTQSRAPPIPV